jgi:hypothetical protein
MTLFTYINISCFLCIKILVFVTRIMPHQFLKINYILLGVITEATQIISVKTHVYNSIVIKCYLKLIA